MDAAVKRTLGKTAIGSSNQVLASDESGQSRDTLGHQLRMLHDIGGVADHARDKHLAGGQLHLAPHLPFVLVARIGTLDHERTDTRLENEINDVAQGYVGGVRPGPASPADVIADALRR